MYVIGANQQTIDVAAFFKNLLREKWHAGNTDGITPRIDHAELHKVVIFGPKGDWITLYLTSENSEPKTITYQFKNVTIVGTLEFLTGESRQHLFKMVEEAERIMHGVRKDTFGAPGTNNLTGRQWLNWNIRGTPYERTAKLHYRKTTDFEVRWKFREVRT